MYIRCVSRRWVTSKGDIRKRVYYYVYESKRVGDKVISKYIRRATEEEYFNYLEQKEKNKET